VPSFIIITMADRPILSIVCLTVMTSSASKQKCSLAQSQPIISCPSTCGIALEMRVFFYAFPIAFMISFLLSTVTSVMQGIGKSAETKHQRKYRNQSATSPKTSLIRSVQGQKRYMMYRLLLVPEKRSTNANQIVVVMFK